MTCCQTTNCQVLLTLFSFPGVSRCNLLNIFMLLTLPDPKSLSALAAGHCCRPAHAPAGGISRTVTVFGTAACLAHVSVCWF